MERKPLLAMFMLGLMVCCQAVFAQVPGTAPSIIPQPLSVSQGSGEFVLSPGTEIVIDPGKPVLKSLGNTLAGCIKNVTGIDLKLREGASQSKKIITLTLKGAPDSLGSEGYKLNVDPSGITIAARAEEGLFYGIQSLIQLMPPTRSLQPVSLAAVKVVDKPRFGWRGMLLDVCRYYYPIDFIKKSLDYMAMHKMNTFHWHLTDDQGWRVEIKKYPRLTELSSKRAGTVIGHARDKPRKYDQLPHGGFYTQDEIREIVAYAKARYITVVPEIEMPGHAVAALAAYPELSCTGGPFEVSQTWGVHDDVFCAGNEQTFKFLEDVLNEVVPLFPSKIIHIGGDEVPKTRWKACPKCQAKIKALGLKDEHELQSYFIRRMENFLQSKGKKIIGWDEILEGGLAPNATVMSWRGVAGGIAAAKQKHDVVMTPDKPFYLDHYQGPRELEPLAIGGYNTLQDVYAYEPASNELSADEKKYIKGAQANVWTEYIATPSHAEYMMFPRLSAVSEVLWSAPAAKNWTDFLRRMESQYTRYDAKRINYAKSAYNVLFKVATDPASKTSRVTLYTDSYQPEIHYTTDGSEPTAKSRKYEGALTIDRALSVKAANFKNGRIVSKISERPVNPEEPVKK